MQTRRWVNQSQPQTLQISVFLLYFNAVFSGLALLSGSGDAFIEAVFTDTRRVIFLVLTAAFIGAGYLIANERTIGYTLGVIAAAFPLAVRVYGSWKYHVGLLDVDALGLLFEAALLALLLHPQSREYQRIWFK
jgi:hypothetical protein